MIETTNTPFATTDELESLRQSIHAEIDATPIHEVLARFIASNQKDVMAGITLAYLTRNETDETINRQAEKSALSEALNC